ncbi:hypothetical protein FQA39_LY04201 [Lamprigera yunnana]|nr:hypothetical protein FQA39_LY04201 [Lamprigera yunnana]
MLAPRGLTFNIGLPIIRLGFGKSGFIIKIRIEELTVDMDIGCIINKAKIVIAESGIEFGNMGNKEDNIIRLGFGKSGFIIKIRIEELTVDMDIGCIINKAKIVIAESGIEFGNMGNKEDNIIRLGFGKSGFIIKIRIEELTVDMDIGCIINKAKIVIAESGIEFGNMGNKEDNVRGVLQEIKKGNG